MLDKDFALPILETRANEIANPKAIRNRNETIELIAKHGGMYGDILDIGERNILTEELEDAFVVKIDSTDGDLDVEFNCPKQKYDFIHYNNVVEHQFNPLFTMLCIREHLNDNGTLILATPVKPNWITWARCHFHEFDEYAIGKLIGRAGFRIIDRTMFWRDISIVGVRPLLGSFYKKQSLFILKRLS